MGQDYLSQENVNDEKKSFFSKFVVFYIIGRII